jgi:hypothetical protein
VVYSNELTVTVFGALSGGVIELQDQSICYSGDPAAFTNVTSHAGEMRMTYSWESKVGAGPWSPIGGANGLTYDVPAGLTQTTITEGQPLMLAEQFIQRANIYRLRTNERWCNFW